MSYAIVFSSRTGNTALLAQTLREQLPQADCILLPLPLEQADLPLAQLLGAAKPVIKAHGSSKAKGIKNAIRQAKLCVANDLCGTMQSALAEVAAKAAAEKTDAE